MTLPFRRTFADQFFGVTWDVDKIFYLYIDDERAAIRAKPKGNVYIQGVRQ